MIAKMGYHRRDKAGEKLEREISEHENREK